jgi:hypothetical protein
MIAGLSRPCLISSIISGENIAYYRYAINSVGFYLVIAYPSRMSYTHSVVLFNGIVRYFYHRAYVELERTP